MTPDNPREDNYTCCDRAVGNAEYDDIFTSGVLRPSFNTLEGKWFADSLEGAMAHGRALYPDGDFARLSQG